MTSPVLLTQLTEQMKVISDKLDIVQTSTTKVQTTARGLLDSRRKTWYSIAFIIAVTVLDIAATVFAYESLTTVHTLISEVTCPTDALFLKTYTPARAATYPGGLPAYMHDMHTIYNQYTVILDCQPHVIDPTAVRH